MHAMRHRAPHTHCVCVKTHEPQDLESRHRLRTPLSRRRVMIAATNDRPVAANIAVVRARAGRHRRARRRRRSARRREMIAPADDTSVTADVAVVRAGRLRRQRGECGRRRRGFGDRDRDRTAPLELLEPFRSRTGKNWNRVKSPSQHAYMSLLYSRKDKR